MRRYAENDGDARGRFSAFPEKPVCVAKPPPRAKVKIFALEELLLMISAHTFLCIDGAIFKTQNPRQSTLTHFYHLQTHNRIHTEDAKFGFRSSTSGQTSTRKCFFTGPEFRLTSQSALKERGCETMSTAVGFRVVLEQWDTINADPIRFCATPSSAPALNLDFLFVPTSCID